MLSDLTEPEAVRKAIAEFDELGREVFLEKYGFGPARRYFVTLNGKKYDSKAIVGAAHGIQHPELGHLTATDFTGGESSVVPLLNKLGFSVIDEAEGAEHLELSSVLLQICVEIKAREQTSATFSSERLSQLVAEDAVAIIRAVVRGEAEVVGRTGIGTAADVPWVGIFLPDSEPSAKQGFYLVYLFSKDGSGVYLSLNQGTEEVRGGMEVLRKRALDLRTATGSQPDLLEDIDLKSENTRPRKYEAGSAYAIYYSAETMPEDERVTSDLRRMLTLLGKADKAGIRWDPEIEPLHLVFKWNAEVEPRTIDIHREIAQREGSVWWGRFSKSPTPTMSTSNFQRLQQQLERGKLTHAYLYRRGMTWVTTVHEVRLDPPPMSDGRFPGYYSRSDCNFFARLSDFELLSADWLVQHAVLASHPDSDPQRLAGALGNQTTPLFVYELVGASAITQPPGRSRIDISEVTLADVCKDVSSKIERAGLEYGIHHEQLVRAAVVSLTTKRFLLLTGLSGSGKTRLGIAIGQWFGPDRLKVVPVRPDWTGPDALFGFENGLSPVVDGHHAWSVPETLEFILRAAADPDNPYLLLLDEMNLAHVERYFADALSGMESESPVVPYLHKRGAEWRLQDPPAISFPSNLYVVGTVNIDETTYMFSPKVLDRANSIEFRVLTADLEPGAVPPSAVESGEPALVRRFLYDSTTVTEDDWPGKSQLADWLRSLHSLLLSYDREFGHRVFSEALRFGALLSNAGEDDIYIALDLQVLQKVLPKFYGSIRQLADPLNALGSWCFYGPESEASASFDPLNPPGSQPLLPMSFNKIQRMTRRLRANHFVSFAE